MSAATRRFPLEPLESYLAHDQEEIGVRQFVTVETTCKVLPSTIARRVGVDRQSVYRWRKQGLPLYSADRAAINLGVHPVLIWPDFHQEEALCE